MHRMHFEVKVAPLIAVALKFLVFIERLQQAGQLFCACFSPFHVQK